jgi:transposase-like protein
MIEQMHEILMNLNIGRIAVSEAQEQLLDLFNVSNPLPDCPHCQSKMNIINPGYTCPECHCHLRG